MDTANLGRVFWITGVTGAGKTTVGSRLHRRLLEAQRNAVFLDGDALREAISSDLDYTIEGRRDSATRNARLCRMLALQGLDVVCSTISLLHDVHRWNRENIPGYCEIFLRVPQSELERRDSKGIYGRVRRGEQKHVIGIDIPAEEPLQPDLVLDNWGDFSPDLAVERIWNRFIDGVGGACAARASLSFSTKAETLEQLTDRLSTARVLPMLRFSVADWRMDPEAVLAALWRQAWGARPKIVRSSSRGEDGGVGSMAGKFRSVPDATTPDEVRQAVADVIYSYGDTCRTDDQVFIQPMLDDIALAGVVMTQDTNSGGPYIVINYDDESRRADTVTSGISGDLKTYLWHRAGRVAPPPELQGIVATIKELERLFGSDRLDVEFATDPAGTVTVLQVRPLAIAATSESSGAAHGAVVEQIADKIEVLNRRHPFLHGDRTVFGVMPDWNPAEIIGLKPRPLSLSLYRELVTDEIWAYQRDNYGYKNLRSFPLLISFNGLPYIDVRVSFNSFVPRDINGDLAERLVTHYVNRLLAQPTLHDKVEFEIIYSCYTPDLAQRMGVLSDAGFSEGDIARLTESLRILTNRIIHAETGLWRLDREKINTLEKRLPLLGSSSLDLVSRIYWLLEDCKRYGTLPFAGLARAGFIAMQLLRSLVSVGVLTQNDYDSFLADLDTVGSRIGRDIAALPREQFLKRYGHLRPGTYDILSPRYDDDPDRYFDWSATPAPEKPVAPFALSVQQLRRIEQLLKEHRLEHDVIGFMEFIKAGIEGREHAKFVFTRHLSDTLSLIGQLGAEHGISNEDCAYLDIGDVRALYGQSASIGDCLRQSIEAGKHRYRSAKSLVLPPLIVDAKECWGFQLPPAQPNFVTQKSVASRVATLDKPPETFAGRILFIPSADPGFDWIFTRGIAGFVTQFGGVNSHMAIRAGELGLPAVVGCGETLYRRWSAARRISLDCGSRQVQVLA